MFRLCAELIASHLYIDERLQASGAALRQEQLRAQLREQCIAVLGRDLRNPLAAIASGIGLIGRTRLDEKAQRLVPMIERSVTRISRLIDDVLDLTRGRLGEGMILSRTECDLEPVLAHVVKELRTAHPDRTIVTDFALGAAVDCDPARLSQVLSNLLADALTYGDVERPVLVRAALHPRAFGLLVSNQGDPIPPEAIDRLFEPFERGAVRPNQQGPGLGLYLAPQVACAHRGRLTAASNPAETRFTLSIPIAARRGRGS